MLQPRELKRAEAFDAFQCFIDLIIQECKKSLGMPQKSSD